jgi:hypothetical protein
VKSTLVGCVRGALYRMPLPLDSELTVRAFNDFRLIYKMDLMLRPGRHHCNNPQRLFLWTKINGRPNSLGNALDVQEEVIRQLPGGHCCGSTSQRTNCTHQWGRSQRKGSCSAEKHKQSTHDKPTVARLPSKWYDFLPSANT